MPRFRPSGHQPAQAILALLLLAILFILAGCARHNQPARGGEPRAQSGRPLVTIKGSDTMVHLVSNWAEALMKDQPGTEISVTGGGSGTGIAALMNGTTDIAAASRDLSEKEKKLAQQKKLALQTEVVGMDGLAVVVNPSNPIKALTLAQLKEIFTGKINNWKAVGGPDLPILLYSRESSSGTYAFFQEHVLKKQDYAQNTRLMPATSGIIEAVATDEGAIGYAGLGYAEEAKNRIKIIGVQAKTDTPPVIPTETTIKDKSYPIARDLYLVGTQPLSPQAAQFMKYTLSHKGQTIVQQSGYIPVR